MPVSQTPKREEGTVKTLGQLLPVEIFVAVDVVDGAGEIGNHVIFRAKGTKRFFRLLPAGAEKVMQPLAGWLNDAVENALSKMYPSEPKEEEDESLPPDMEVPV